MLSKFGPSAGVDGPTSLYKNVCDAPRTITLNITVRGKSITVELIEGTDECISPEVLSDAVKTAANVGDVLVPSWAHFVAMKAEAHYDRLGQEKQKYLGDLTLVRARLEERGVKLRRKELGRVIRMRHKRKQDDMLATVFRIFEKPIT